MTSAPVLIVDDNEGNRQLLYYLLSSRGYEVRTVKSASEAGEVIPSFHPQVILTDIHMPGMDGYDFARRLKADPATRDIVVLALTAYAMSGDETRALAAGCDGYLCKPINTRTLPGVIAAYLARRPPAQA